MSDIDPLAQLHDIHSPPPIGWWPPAPGWWLVAGLFVIALIAGGVWLWRNYHQRRYRRLALQQLHAVYREHQAQHDDNSHFVYAINRLLKQCALAAFPRSDIAALSGAEWLDFLDRHLRKPRFTDPDLRALANLYQPTPPAIAPDTLRDAAEYWIRRHRC